MKKSLKAAGGLRLLAGMAAGRPEAERDHA